MSKNNRLLSVLCLLGLLCISSAERATYDYYRVYKTQPENKAQLAVLKQLEASSDSIIFVDGIHVTGVDVHIVVAPHKVPDFLEILGKHEVNYKLIEKNFQSLLDNGDEQVSLKGRNDGYNWAQYYELNDTYIWLQNLAKQYPGIVTLIEGGKTYERRSILGVKISKGKSQNPGIFLEAGIHAREWIGPAAATYIINQLLSSEETSIKDLALNYDWYIFPHANPDGYVHTHTTDRMWRKTRTLYDSCFGADPNRNWGFHWNEVGASSNACSDTYAGPYEFSEIETLSLSNYIKSLKGKIQLYISFHSYSQYLLYPFGHTSELPDNAADYQQVFNAATEAIRSRYGTKYTGGNIFDAIYPAAGGSIDWAYATQDIRMAFCYELRPSSNSIITGFRLPAAQIIPTAEETLDSITTMIAEIKNLGYFN